MSDFNFEIDKIDEEKRQLSGFFLTSHILDEESGQYVPRFDKQDDAPTSEFLEDAGKEFMSGDRKVNLLHTDNDIGHVPYMINITEDHARGETIFKGIDKLGLYGTVEIEKPYWNLCKELGLNAFSVEGSCKRKAYSEGFMIKMNIEDNLQKGKDFIEKGKINKISIVSNPAQYDSYAELIKSDQGNNKMSQENVNDINKEDIDSKEAVASITKENNMTDKIDVSLLEKQLSPAHKEFYDSILNEKDQESFLKADYGKKEKIMEKSASKDPVIYKSGDKEFRKGDIDALVGILKEKEEALTKMVQAEEDAKLRKQAEELEVFSKSEDLAMVVVKAFNTIDDDKIRKMAFEAFAKSEEPADEEVKTEVVEVKVDDDIADRIEKALKPIGSMDAEDVVDTSMIKSVSDATAQVDRLVEVMMNKEPGISEYEARDKVYLANPKLKLKEMQGI